MKWNLIFKWNWDSPSVFFLLIDLTKTEEYLIEKCPKRHFFLLQSFVFEIFFYYKKYFIPRVVPKYPRDLPGKTSLCNSIVKVKLEARSVHFKSFNFSFRGKLILIKGHEINQLKYKTSMRKRQNNPGYFLSPNQWYHSRAVNRFVL